MIEPYLETIDLIERCRRAFLDALKRDLVNHGIHGINSVQAYTLFKIGEGEVSVGDVKAHCYSGTNATYTLARLVKNGYVEQRQSPSDRRMCLVRLTPKGSRLCDEISPILRRYADRVEREVPEQNLNQAAAVLRLFARVWSSPWPMSR
jgi:DNA-binding MarR family transcriptional regulator